MIANNILGITYNRVIYYEDLSFEPNTDFNFLNIPSQKNFIKFSTLKSPEKNKVVSNYNELRNYTRDYLKGLSIINVAIDEECLQLI